MINKLKSVRREKNTESFRKELEDGKRQVAMLSEQFPFLRTILPAENSERKETESAGDDGSVEERLVVSVNLFG